MTNTHFLILAVIVLAWLVPSPLSWLDRKKLFKENLQLRERNIRMETEIYTLRQENDKLKKQNEHPHERRVL
jgi:cell division protein FtsB